MSVAAGTGENFDVGRVLSQVGALIGRNFVPFFVLSLLFAGLPALLIFVIQMNMLGANPVEAMQTGAGSPYGLTTFVLFALLATLPAYVLQAALTRASIDDLTGKGVSIGAAVQAGLRYLLPLIGLGIIMSLGIGAALLVFVIPGIILAVCWIVSSPVLIVEKTGVFQAMQRSLQLTRNHRWALFGMLVLYIIVFFVINVVMGLVMGGTMGAFGGTSPALIRPTLVTGVIQAFVGSFEVMLTTVAIAAIYFELRRIKDGVGVTELASVFD